MINAILLSIVNLFVKIERYQKFYRLLGLIKRFLHDECVTDISFDSAEVEIFTTEAVYVYKWDSQHRQWFLLELIDLNDDADTIDYLNECLEISPDDLDNFT